MNEQLSLISAMLDDLFDGNAWHGPNIMKVLDAIDDKQASLKPLSHRHTILELVHHMTVWRNFVIEKLNGNTTYDVDDNINFNTPDSWPAVLENFKKSQRILTSALKTMDPEKLNEVVSGREYSVLYLLHGIIHHDLYHLGQVSLLQPQIR